MAQIILLLKTIAVKKHALFVPLSSAGAVGVAEVEVRRPEDLELAHHRVHAKVLQGRADRRRFRSSCCKIKLQTLIISPKNK